MSSRQNDIPRRRILSGGLTAVGATVLGWGSYVRAEAPLGAPEDLANLPALRSENGLLKLTQRVALGETTLPQGPATLRMYNGNFPSPTWVVHPGDRLEIELINDLPPNEDAHASSAHAHQMPHVRPNKLNTTNLHYHGFHVDPRGNSDNVLLEIEPGERFSYVVEIPSDHPVGTYWYHPHRHGSVAVQIASGMAGMIAIEPRGFDPEMVTRELVIQSPMVGPDGRLDDPEIFMNIASERVFTINGVFRPKIHLRAGEPQYWRMLQANDSQFLHLDFRKIPGLSAYLLGRDGNPLTEFAPLETLELSPGNRVDLMVQADQPGSYDLIREAFDQGLFQAPELLIGQLVVTPGGGGSWPGPQAILDKIPAENHPPAAISGDEIVMHRSFTLGTEHNENAVFETAFTINGKPYIHDVIDVEAQRGTAEEWEWINLTPFPHPLHIHVNPFQVIEVNGEPLPDRPWYDTFMVPPAGTVKVRMRFEDFFGDFVMHCHILPHEDAGMMINVRILE